MSNHHIDPCFSGVSKAKHALKSLLAGKSFVPGGTRTPRCPLPDPSLCIDQLLPLLFKEVNHVTWTTWMPQSPIESW